MHMEGVEDQDSDENQSSHMGKIINGYDLNMPPLKEIIIVIKCIKSMVTLLDKLYYYNKNKQFT